MDLSNISDLKEGGYELDGMTEEEKEEFIKDCDEAVNDSLNRLQFRTSQINNKKLNRTQVFKRLYLIQKFHLIQNSEITEVKSIQLANIFAVKNTERVYLNYQSEPIIDY